MNSKANLKKSTVELMKSFNGGKVTTTYLQMTDTMS